MQESVEQRANEIEISIQELLIMYLRKWWVIGICAIIAAAAAFLMTWKFVTPMYRAAVTVYVNNNRVTEEKETLSNADMVASIRLVNTYISIVKSDRVIDEIAEALNGDYTNFDLRLAISAEQVADTEIFAIYAVHSDPAEAARIANAAAEVVPVEISGLIEGTSARVVDKAKVPTGRFSPSYSRSTMIGGVIGAVVALVFLTVLYLSDARIKDENDLVDMFQLPILGRIPDFEATPSENKYGYGYGESEEGKNREEADQ